MMVLVVMIFRQWQHPQKLMWVGVVFWFSASILFHLCILSEIPSCFDSSEQYMITKPSELHVVWKISRTIGWLWHPEKGGQQILACKLRLIVAILPYGFIQSTAIAKKNPPKNIGHVQFELKVSLEKHVLFHFGMISGSSHIFWGHGNVSDHS